MDDQPIALDLSKKSIARRPRRTTEAVTLLEILAVVTIGLILLALVFPAFGGIKKRAQGVQCLSNLKTLGAACLTYAADNEFYLPSPNDEPTHANNYMITFKPWLTLVNAGYLSTNDLRVFYCPTMTHGQYGPIKSNVVDWPRMSYLYYPDFTINYPDARERLGIRTSPRALVSDNTRFGGETIPTFHDGKGITAFFTDGSAAFVATTTNWFSNVTTKYPGSKTSLGGTELTALSQKLYQSH